jgi:magnesium transporter
MIINSVAYPRHGKPFDVTLDCIPEALADAHTFVWLGVVDPDIDELREVQRRFALHDLAIEDALVADQRPKLESYGNTLFIVVRTAHMDDVRIAFGETHIFVGPNFVVTVRHGDSASYAQVREKAQTVERLLSKGPAYVLYAILDFVVDHYSVLADALQERFRSLEGDIFTSRFDREAIERLYGMKSDLIRLRSAVMPVEQICSELIRLHEDVVSKELRAYFRDIQDHVSRVVDILDVVREMLTTAIQVNLALVSVSQNEITKRLAGWGAVLAVPTIVFSLYGMNFKHMPELDLPWAYPMVVGVTVAACAGIYYRFRQAGWL